LASALVLLVVGLIAPIFRIATRSWHRTEEAQSVQRDTLALSYRLRSDYLASRPQSLRVEPQDGGTQLSFLSYQGVGERETLWTPNGEIIWRKWVQYRFRQAEHRVRRRETALASPGQDPAEPPPVWNDQDAHTVAWNVAVFDLQSTSGSLVLRLNLTARQGLSSSGTAIAVLPLLYGSDVVSP
jgi:hypothetical protein